jgi:DNA-binding NarL/FixJ family response regulator
LRGPGRSRAAGESRTAESHDRLRVIIADDHAIVRRGLRQILEHESDITTVGEASTADDLLRHLDACPYDVLVLDISMPGRSGLDVLPEIRRRFPELAVLILSVHSEDQFAVRCLKLGAAGYLNKESAPEELVRAIRRVRSGRRYVRAGLEAQLEGLDEKPGSRAPHEALSAREAEVLLLIASGKTVGEVAALLELSVKTVSTYRTRVLGKMGMETNAQLTYYAIKNALVD